MLGKCLSARWVTLSDLLRSTVNACGQRMRALSALKRLTSRKLDELPLRMRGYFAEPGPTALVNDTSVNPIRSPRPQVERLRSDDTN